MEKKIIIARHGRPALDRNLPPKLTWQDYQDWWARYEAGGLAEGQSPPTALRNAASSAHKVYTSQRRRAQQTARMAAPLIAAEIKAEFNEAPLPPPRIMGKFLPKHWNVIARTAWMWGHSLDGESKTEAEARAKNAAEILDAAASTHGTVFVAAHGWFNRMMRPELKRIGWRCTQDGGDSYWSYRVYEPRT